MDNINEVWKDIDGYDGMYKVSNLGNVYSKYVNRNLKHGKTKDGYPYVMLRNNGKQKCNLIHRLVAQAFIPNPDNLPCVNHKDENTENYSIDNLEWCTVAYNNTYNNAYKKRALKLAKEVYAYNNKGELVYHYCSTREAARELDYSAGDIWGCCTGRLYTYKNLVWSNKELTKDEVIEKFNYSCTMNQKNNSRSTAVNKFDMNHKFICQYPSVNEGGRQMGISPSLISGVCRGEHKYTHGFIFEYA